MADQEICDGAAYGEDSMKKPCFLLILLLIFGTNAAPALADSFGDMIAENLCVNPAATLTLSDADSVRYDNATSIKGKYSYKTENNFSVTSKFEKTLSNAFCERTTHPVMGTENSPPIMGTVMPWRIIKDGNTLKNALNQ